MKLLVATRNRHKLQEIRAILDLPHLTILGADEVPGLPEVEEDGATFEANAIKKAAALARASGMWSLSDDSGLEVDALDRAPGVYSARYAGGHGDDRANCEKVLRELGARPDRRARFRCVLALAAPGEATRTVEGRCEGTIAHEIRGTHGFGYDPIFIPSGHDRTFGELPAELKNRISHRSAALREAANAWRALLGS